MSYPQVGARNSDRNRAAAAMSSAKAARRRGLLRVLAPGFDLKAFVEL